MSESMSMVDWVKVTLNSPINKKKNVSVFKIDAWLCVIYT